MAPRWSGHSTTAPPPVEVGLFQNAWRLEWRAKDDGVVLDYNLHSEHDVPKLLALAVGFPDGNDIALF